MEMEEEEAHERLVRSVVSLDKKSRKQKREKPSLTTNPERSAGDELRLEDLVGAIDDSKGLGDLKNQLTVSQNRTKVLSAPLHQQAREKVLRGIAYQDTKRTLKEWTGIIQKNRTADQLIFPPEQEKVTLGHAKGTESSFKARSHLEIESARILGKSKHNMKNSEEYTEAERELMKALSLKEIKAKTQEIQKMRHLMSYQEAKAKRQRKIKSKRYHRLLKRQKRREILKEFEDLKERDPLAANERLELLEKDRIMERAVLKHRGTGQWAKQLRLHARHDEKTRVALGEQLKLGRELKEKVQREDSAEDAAVVTEPQSSKKISLEDVLARMEDRELDESIENPDNPWLVSKVTKLRQNKNLKEKNTVMTNEPPTASTSVAVVPDSRKRKATPPLRSDSEVLNNKNGTEVHGKATERKKKRRSKTKPSGESIDEIFNDLNEKILDSVKEPEETTDNIEENYPENSANREGDGAENSTADTEKDEIDGGKDATDAVIFDPKKFMGPQAPILKTTGNLIDNEEGDEGRESFLAEAFRDDKVLVDFEEEKGALVEEETPKDLDLNMPGWGDWAGAGIDLSKRRKKKRLIIKAAPQAPRKDRLLPGVIISEKEDNSIRKLQVSDLPFPFSCVEDFESTIRHPLGPEWNTELGHKSLTEPTVLSRRGRIIQPMDKEAVLRHRKDLDSDQSD